MKKEAKDEFVTGWMDKIRTGLEYRKRYSTETEWEDYRKMYRGQWAAGTSPVNRIFSFGRMLIPKVYFSAPRVSITATRPDLVWHAKVVEAIDNQLIRETMLKETLKRASLDGYLTGTGPIKLGYDSEFGFLPEQIIGEDSETLTQTGQKDGEKIEYRTGIQSGMPWALRCRPEDIIVPWGSGEASSLPWICHYIVRPLDDVKQDQKYKNTADLKGTRAPDMGGRKKPNFKPRAFEDKDIAYAELWEVRDAKTGMIMVFCEEKLLLSQPDALQIDGLPYEFIQFNPDPDYFWSISDASILSPHQSELNDVNTQTAQHRQIALLKFLYLKDTLKGVNLEQFFSGKVGPGIEVEGDSLQGAVTVLQPHIPPDLITAKREILADMKEALGFNSNQLSGFKEGTPPTAAEAGIVQGAFEERIDERRDIVADTLVRIIRKWNQMIFSFWTQEKVVQIVSPQGTPFWMEYTGDQLKGEYFLSVDPDSGMPVGRQMKYQVAKEMFGLFNGDQTIDQTLLRKIVLGYWSSIEPQAQNLLASPPEVNPQMEAGMRQPSPMMPGGGGGQAPGPGAGGPGPSGPREPIPLEQASKRLGGS